MSRWTKAKTPSAFPAEWHSLLLQIERSESKTGFFGVGTKEAMMARGELFRTFRYAMRNNPLQPISRIEQQYRVRSTVRETPYKRWELVVWLEPKVKHETPLESVQAFLRKGATK